MGQLCASASVPGRPPSMEEKMDDLSSLEEDADCSHQDEKKEQKISRGQGPRREVILVIFRLLVGCPLSVPQELDGHKPSSFCLILQQKNLESIKKRGEPNGSTPPSSAYLLVEVAVGGLAATSRASCLMFSQNVRAPKAISATKIHHRRFPVPCFWAGCWASHMDGAGIIPPCNFLASFLILQQWEN